MSGAAGRIRRLSEELVNKIAAGEVVERPASVVKELVENALDALARRVSVEIESGGKALVRVVDDGSGMGREDARLALERHATSKLAAFEDLARLATHGFRGEALPAIAGVSQLVLRTREEASPVGTEVEVRHGRLVHVRDAGHPRGTTVEVRDLFGGVPARRKFLRADSTESAHVAEAVALVALAHPQVGFSLRSGKRELLTAPPVDGLRARLYQVYSGELVERLLPVEWGEGGLVVRGFVSRPERDARGGLRLFVNGRPIRDRALTKAVYEAYQLASAGERRPEGFLFVELAPELVDVNVHPAKAEVRFAEPRAVFLGVQHAVRTALSEGARREAPVAAGAGRVAEAVDRYLARSGAGVAAESGRLGWGGATAGAAPGSTEQGGDRDAAGTEGKAAVRDVAVLEALPEATGPSEPGPVLALGQHRNTYIVASDGEELLLVDQHTAHERVRFEALVERLEARRVESQLLLTPLVVPLAPELAAVVDAQRATLAELGFDVEDFGGGSLRLASLPALLAGHDPAGVLEALLRDYLEREAGPWAVAGARARLAATLACHSSVRAGQALPLRSQQAILDALATTTHPTLCPHGRPTSVRVPREELSRWFGRSGWRRQ